MRPPLRPLLPLLLGLLLWGALALARLPCKAEGSEAFLDGCHARFKNLRASNKAIQRESVNGATALVYVAGAALLDETAPLLLPLATHASVNRLHRAEELIDRWSGPVFVGIYVDREECRDESLAQSVLDWAERRRNASVLIVVSTSFSRYPVNLMRNIVLEYGPQRTYAKHTRVTHLLLLDVDALPNHAMARIASDARVSGLPLNGFGILPAFEAAHNEQHDVYNVTEKSELAYLYRKGSVREMHHRDDGTASSYTLGSTLPVWLDETKPSLLEMEYRFMMEPYAVIPKNIAVYFDERFIGFGFNKQSWWMEVWATGKYTFHILPSSFVVDRPNSSMQGAARTISNETRAAWQKFRERIMREYRVRCDPAQLALCDTHRRRCDTACVRPPVESSFVLPSSDPTLKHERAQVQSECLVRGASMKSTDERALDAYAQRLADPKRAPRVLRPNVPREACLSSMDFVYTWVNGSDPSHVRARKSAIPSHEFTNPVHVTNKKRMRSDHDLTFRFRDYGDRASTLRYSLRSLARHARGVVGRVYVVVANGPGQIPGFLREERYPFPVKIVRHDEIFENPSECLPTFNSCAIETQLHRIPGLSPCYVYLNDDVLLTSDLDPGATWWPAGEPAPFARFEPTLAPRNGGKDLWQRKITNVARDLSRVLGLSHEEIFLVGHTGHFFIKSVVAALEMRMRAQFQETAKETYRTSTSLWVPFAYANFYASQYAEVKIRRVEPSVYFAVREDEESIERLRGVLRDVRPETTTWLCLNDLVGDPDPRLSAALEDVLAEGLNRLFPPEEVP